MLQHNQLLIISSRLLNENCCTYYLTGISSIFLLGLWGTAEHVTEQHRCGQALDRSSRARIVRRSNRFVKPRPQGTLAGKEPQVVSVIYVKDQRGLVW